MNEKGPRKKIAFIDDFPIFNFGLGRQKYILASIFTLRQKDKRTQEEMIMIYDLPTRSSKAGYTCANEISKS